MEENIRESFELSRRKGKNVFHTHDYTGVPTAEDYAEREKSWQRVPATFLILVLGVYLLFVYLTQLIEDDMARVITEGELAVDDAQTFSEETALRYLDQVTGDQPRVAGTRYHLQKTIDLKNITDGIAARARIPVHTDWQIASGDLFLQNYSFPYTCFYENVSNVIALLEGRSGFHSNGSVASSILVNCHYDSVPFALGVSDNAIFCASMLEILARWSRRAERFRHNVVFLFNGAEENGLQASHAFLSHPWARGARAVVNLDAAGMNGKATLFQVTDARAVAMYRRATGRPYAQSFGEFLFSSGIIPSDTDFRIWRDFGNINGIDIAFMKWGHVYHTRYDSREYLRRGVVQTAGATVMSVLAAMADSEEMDTQVTPEAAVYYDYLNAFMVTYSLSAAAAVDSCALAVAAAAVGYYLWVVGFRAATATGLLLAAGARLAAAAGGAALAGALSPAWVSATVQLRYLSQPWVVVACVWVPYLAGAVAVSHAADASRQRKTPLTRSLRSLEASAASLTLLALFALGALIAPGTATVRYMLSLPLLLHSVCLVVCLTVVRLVRLTGWQHLLMATLVSLPLVLWLFSISLRVNSLMLPVLGRTPTDHPDYIVVGLNTALAVFVCCSVSGIELLFSRKRLWMVLSGCVAVCVVIMFVPWSPYQDDGPSTQRHYWFHTQITSYTYDNTLAERVSGVLVTKHDANTINSMLRVLEGTNFNLNMRTDFTEDCETKVYCGLPLYRTLFGPYLKDSLFLYTGPPAAPAAAPALSAARACSADLCTLTLTMSGPPHNMVTLWPRANATIVGWSLDSPVEHSGRVQGRPYFVLRHARGTHSDDPPPFVFSVYLTVPQSLQSQPIIDVSHNAHKIHHPEDFTAEYQSLLDAMPKYFNVASFITFKNNYEF